MKHPLFPITGHNHVDFYEDGGRYCDKFLGCIRDAKKSIHLQTYIFDLDAFGKQVKRELIAASKRGVKVYLLVDSVGSRNLISETEAEFNDCGIYFCRFNSIQVKWLYRWGRRLHHKILLIDSLEAIVGGINVLYACAPGSSTPQLDFAVCLKGPVIEGLSHYCQNVFKRAYGKSKLKILPEKIITPYIFSKGFEVGISINDWILGRSKITRQYTRMTTEAKECITIINSYFFPRRKFMKQLAQASARGVRVRLILPKYSDWPSYILASEYLYDYFLKHGIEIYQWKKSILHGKLATIDNCWSTIGSFNLNYTSYQQNLEMNVDIYSREFTETLNHRIEHIIKSGCIKVETQALHEKSPLKIKAARVIFYLILSLIANFSIGLSFQEDHNKTHRFFHILRIISSMVFFVLGVLGAILPRVPGFPFFIISFILIYKQILLNRRIL